MLKVKGSGCGPGFLILTILQSPRFQADTAVTTGCGHYSPTPIGEFAENYDGQEWPD
jgi:hypothetical protein